LIAIHLFYLTEENLSDTFTMLNNRELGHSAPLALVIGHDADCPQGLFKPLATRVGPL
jgi:hypothetical protein